MKEAGILKKRIHKIENKVVPLRKIVNKPVPELLLRNAFKMKLKPGFAEEYKKRHDAIWPELSRVLREAGISDYSIYLDENTNTLFAFQRLAPGHTTGDLPNDLVVRQWWNFMSDIMEYNDDGTPVAIALEEMFHMD